MKKNRKFIVASFCIVLTICMVLATCIALAIIIFGATSMSDRFLFRMPPSYIENKISQEIPFGSNIQDVKEKILQHDEWESNLRVYSDGTIYGSDGKVVRNYGGQLKEGEYYVGTQLISVDIGNSWFWFTDVYFAFDENDKLIDIAVYKEFAIE